MEIIASIIVTVFALVGVALVLLQGPGIWVALAIALVCKWWQPELLSWWTIGLVALIAALAEVAEFAAGAVGAAKAKGTKAGVWGAILGSIVGLILGTMFIPVPILGSVIGAIIGAGLGAFVAERGVSQRTWKESAQVAQGAAVGRLLSTVIKTAMAGVAAAVLILSAWL